MAVATDFFDSALHHLGQVQATERGDPVFVLNLGAMDGMMFDEMYGYTCRYGFRGLYVEPIPYLFQRLKSNLGTQPGGSQLNLFENSAISSYDGEIEMLTVDQAAIDSGQVPPCFYGMSSVSPAKNGLGSEGDKAVVDKHGVLVKVPCITFASLLAKHSIISFDVVKMDAEGHDYEIFKQIDLGRYQPKVVRLEWINLSKEEQKHVVDAFRLHGYTYDVSGQDITGLSPAMQQALAGSPPAQPSATASSSSAPPSAPGTGGEGGDEKGNEFESQTTLVTGLWNIGRSELGEGWSRSYQHYLDQFAKLLELDRVNMIIYGDVELQSFVNRRRRAANTQFVVRSLDWFKQNDYHDKIQRIRTTPTWYDRVGWLRDSTQARLDMYNPIVMSKMFLLHDACVMDRFESKYLFWIDAGIASTVHPGYFTHDRVLRALASYTPKFTFIAFPYETTTEIHGFEYSRICEYAGGQPVTKVARGGFFGGPKQTIPQLNSIYYGLLMDTLANGLMGTEESLFTIIMLRHMDLVNHVEIKADGLLGTFFEDLKNKRVLVRPKMPMRRDIKVHLYVLTYNIPQQLEHLLTSFEQADKRFLTLPKKFLLNNSTDVTTDARYDQLCQQYGFEQIKKNNIGICGGRQFIAEHFDASDADYYLFFEDDMLLHHPQGSNGLCSSGFRTHVTDLYQKTLEIMRQEDYDYLKLSFTELYGSNETQWAWYNVPDAIRAKHFPGKTLKPAFGFDPNAPLTQFTTMKRHRDLMYLEGEVYYCNWPLWMSKSGNRRVFLEPRYEHPYEQTWMSLAFQKHKSGSIKTAVLLLSPINHQRIQYYSASERREN